MLVIEMFEHPDMVCLHHFSNVRTQYMCFNCPSSGEMDNAYKKKNKKLKISKDSVDNNTNTPTDTKSDGGALECSRFR